MKQLVLKITSLCFALTLFTFSALTVSAEDGAAAGDTLTLNDEATVKTGDTVTYSLYLGDTVEPIVGFELRLFYDSEYLEYQKGSLKFEKFDVVVYNEDIEGKIPMNSTSLTNLPLFDKKSQFLSADFKVKKGGKANISYFFTELYGENMTYLKSFTFTYGLTVGDKAVVTDGVPLVNTDDETLQNNQGDFINYADGMGENSPNQGSHEEVRGSLAPYVQTEIVEVTRSVSGSGTNSGGLPGSVLFILIAAPILIAAVVAAVVIVNKKNKNGGENEPANSSETENSVENDE